MNIQEYLIFRHTLSQVKWKPIIDFKKKQTRDTTTKEVDDILTSFLPSNNTTCFLSGGVDSSLLAAIFKPKDAYVAYFDDIEVDEDYWADLVAEHLGIKLHRILITRERYTSTLEYLIRQKGDGIHPNEPCLYLVAQQIRKDGYKTVLSGEGADDLFGGYSDLFLNEDKYMKDKKTFFKRYSYSKYTSDKVFDFDTYKKWGMEQFILRVHTPGLITRGLDACHMAGIDIRFPYLTNDLQQMIWETKKELKKEKILLKKVAEKYLPKEIVYREKIGFPIPIDKWFGGIEEFLKLNVDIWRNIH